MKRLLLALLIIPIAFSCQNKKSEGDETASENPPAETVKLTKKWESEPTLTTCESVIYDSNNDALYVANINGAPDNKDGNGFISKLSLDGTITAAEWVKGLDAPKGMGISGGKLYVADIDQVREIDISSAKITNSYPIQGAKFLNDITIGEGGKVYVSDTGTGIIHVIENGKASPWLENVQGGPNGLLAEGDQMIVLTFQSGNLNTVGYADKQLTMKADGIENADGVEAIGGGEYFVSSWNGMVHHVGKDWKRTTLLDTRADSVNAADIEYVADRKLLLIPAFFKNKVVAYEVSR